MCNPRKIVVLLVSADKPAKTEEIEEEVFKKINIKMGEEVFIMSLIENNKIYRYRRKTDRTERMVQEILARYWLAVNCREKRNFPSYASSGIKL